MSKFTTLALAFAALTAGASAQFIYGINDQSKGGGIYLIDTQTGAATQVAGTHTGGAQPNGLATDLTNGFAYHGAGSGNKSLYRTPLSGGPGTLVDTLGFTTASATLGNNHYYYWRESSRELRKVDLTTFAESVAFTYVPGANQPTSLSFGDLATTGDGVIFGSSIQGDFRLDLNTNSFAWLNIRNNQQLQLGFSGSRLYGIRTSTDEIFEIDPLTGNRTFKTLLMNRNLEINDAANAPVPEPGTVIALGCGAAALLRKRRAAR